MDGYRTLRDSPAANGPYWLVREGGLCGHGLAGLPTLELPGYGKILPIFSSEEDALGFLQRMSHLYPASSLEAVYTGRARLAAALRCAAAGIDRVAFDPLPEPHFLETVELASLCTGAFVDRLLGRGRAWMSSNDRDHALRRRPGVVGRI